jgi:uncharacterized membrane protein YfcA
VSGLDRADEAWLDRMPWGCAWFIVVPVVVGGLVGASVIGNMVDNRLPRDFGLVGVVVAVCIMALIMSLLFAPTKLWRVVRGARRRRPRQPPTV